MIDLRSDTFTKPTPEMLKAMFSAEVGDDVFGEDPSVNKLEALAADMFGKEAALFCSSGTQTNQVGINVHTQPGDDVICDQYAHIRYYEGGGIAANSGSSVTPLPGKNGLLNANQIRSAIKADDPHFPRTKLIALENTSNKGGGTIYDKSTIEEIGSMCRELGLSFHLDGARLFNALVESDYDAKFIGDQFDSISICLSKGLGAPVGSVLLGNRKFIHQARRVRKRFGGGMRQAGYLAAAGIFALEENVDRLKDDHKRAKEIAEMLSVQDYVESVQPVETNIVIVHLKQEVDEHLVLEAWKSRSLLALSLGPKMIRLVTHLDFDDQMLSELKSAINVPLSQLKR